MQDATAGRYLERIGYAGDTAPTSETLGALMEQHLGTVPFENLSIHLGEIITLDDDALVHKIVDRRRGGFCYELNGAFAALLRHLGFDVTVMACRVFTPTGLTAPFDHLTLRVDLDRAWLVDVGFGRFTRQPVLLLETAEQDDPAGPVRITQAERDDLDVYLGEEPQMRIEQRSRQLAEFGPTCWYHQTSPESHFTQSMTCSLPTKEGRVTLSERRLITTVDGRRDEHLLESDGEVLQTYRDVFGIELDRVPVLRGPDPARPQS